MAHYQSVELQASPRLPEGQAAEYFDAAPSPDFYAGPHAASHASFDTEKYRDGSQVNLHAHAEQAPVLTYGGRRLPGQRTKSASRRKWLIIGGVALLAVIALAAALGGVFGSKKSKDSTDGDSADASPFKDGTMVTMDNGVSFRYNNSFGGWYAPIPLDFSARAQKETKPLNEDWDFSVDRIYGVNLGGWFVLEPFITPALFEPYAAETPPVVDEYGLSEKWGANLSTAMEEHYNTFITEMDFAQIAAAGLNWVRLPIPYWAIETMEGEPFLEGVCWKYILKAIEWSRKYGLRMELDLHAMPGSQNGQNHSGKVGSINFLMGAMGIANAQRSLNYIRTLVQFASQPQFAPIIPLFAIGNEIAYLNIGGDQVKAFYLEAYNIVRGITGTGSGKGPYMVIHDGFVDGNLWPGFMTGADRLALGELRTLSCSKASHSPFEMHRYLAYSPDLFITDVGHDLSRPCVWWQPGNNASLNNFGYTFTGEWCLAINDCGQWINGLGTGSHYGGNFNSTATTPVGDCANYVNYKTFPDAFKTQLKQLTAMYMDHTRGSFFWSWRMGANSTGEIPNPLWSYKLGLDEGWIPADPRLAAGACQSIPAELNIEAPESLAWSPPLSAWMTGGDGAGTMAAAATANFTQWPPTSLVGTPTVANLYTYTQTGTPITMSVSTPPPAGSEGATVNAGNGWANAADTAPAYAPISGCSYPNAFSGAALPYPTEPPCQGAPAAKQKMRRFHNAAH